MAVAGKLDLARVAALKEETRRDLGKAQVRFRAVGTYEGGTGTRVEMGPLWQAGGRVDDHGPFTITTDSPRPLLGGGTGPNPLELVLAAVASSVAAGYALHAAAMGIALDSIEATVMGDLDLRGMFGTAEGIRPGFQNMRCYVTVATGAGDDHLKELQSRVERSSALLDIIRNPVTLLISTRRA
ncbi:MAG: OsmC family protein [Armatimonadetes bacterium]|nr:OsmC family protein [Armatimonadota bacterium]